MWHPVLICHQLRSPDNLGAIARVMANFGLSELILSDPATHDFRGAERLGIKGEAILDTFAVARSLSEALSGVVYAVGTTSRTRLKRFTPLTPEEGIAKLAEHSARGKVALVLGGEKRGLSDEELACCHDVLVIPTPGPQPSMNIAQAAGLLSYLVARSQVERVTPREPGARLETVQALEKVMREALLASEFLNPQAPDNVLKELSRCLVRGALTQREAELWLAAFVHLARVTSRALR